MAYRLQKVRIMFGQFKSVIGQNEWLAPFLMYVYIIQSTLYEECCKGTLKSRRIISSQFAVLLRSLKELTFR